MKNSHDGFVSIFTTIMISLLLLVITTSLISTQTIQLRKTEDSEQTLRAYYAAEAGVEDAVGKVLNKTIYATSDTDLAHGANQCNKSTGFDSTGVAEWTCQYVTFSGNPTGKLDNPDAAKTIDTGSITTFRSVIVQWNQSTNSSPGYYSSPGYPTGNFPPAAAYTKAPPLELSILQYPPGGFNANQVCTTLNTPLGCVTKLQNVLIVPDGPGTAAHVNYTAGLLGNGPQRGSCGPLGRAVPAVGGTTVNDYNCYAVLDRLPAANWLFRVRSRYSATSYKFTFKTGNTGDGTAVPVPDGTATIDVTAKAGDTFRRVVSKLPLTNGAASSLNFVIYSDTDVCKNFTVIDNLAQGAPCS